MANPNLSEIVTTTLRNRSKVLADNVTRNNALLTRLNRRGKIKTFSGGRTIVEEIAYANNQTFQWYSGYQVLNISPSTVLSAAEYPIRQSAVNNGLGVKIGDAPAWLCVFLTAGIAGMVWVKRKRLKAEG